jgi:2-polyprenyl-3-methyl-5-hydroxy-6-metoxy-1,4-benzoquinol methylase
VRRSLPYLGNKILELESHTGLVSRLLPQREKLVVSDCREECIRFLENLFDGNSVVKVMRLDPDSEPDENLPNNEFDTVLYIHGLQKTENDTATLKRIYKMIRPGGKAVLIVPQHPLLYCGLDKTLGYQRRYTKQHLSQLCRETGFHIVKCQSIHTASYFSWFLNGVFFRRNKIGKIQLKILNMLIPLSGFLSFLLPGGNLFLIAEKPNQ